MVLFSDDAFSGLLFSLEVRGKKGSRTRYYCFFFSDKGGYVALFVLFIYFVKKIRISRSDRTLFRPPKIDDSDDVPPELLRQ